MVRCLQRPKTVVCAVSGLALLPWWAPSPLPAAEPAEQERVKQTASEGKALPMVIQRYEQLLLRSPGPGTAFDKVYQHFLENDGLDALDARWAEMAKGEDNAWAVTLVQGLLAQRRGRDDQASEAFAKLTKLAPEDYRSWTSQADDAYSRGDFEEAAKAMQTALALEVPASSKLELYQKLARLQERAFESKDALKTYRALAAEFPDDPFALEEAGQALLRAEQWEEAEDLYQKLLTLAADDPYQRVTVTMRLAEIDERQDRHAEAIDRYEAMLDETNEASWMHRELRRLIEDIYRRQDDLAGLIAYYEKRLEKHPTDLAATVKLSDVYFELNRKREGLEALEKAVSLAPDRPELQWQLAKRYLDLEQYEPAIEVLTKLQERRPEEARFAELLGRAYWNRFQADEKPEWKDAALKAWAKIAPTDNKQPRLALYQAETYQSHGLDEEAIASFQQAIELDPGNAETRERLATLLWGLEQDEKAKTVLQGLVEGAGRAPENYLRLAKIYRRHEDAKAALSAVEEGLKLKADHFDLLALKWALLADEEQWAEALKLYPLLLAAAPNSYFVHEIENRQIQALSNLNQLETFREAGLAKIAGRQEVEEAELRLLLRACLQTRQLEAAEKVLEYGRRQYQDSVLLTRLEAEFYRRSGKHDHRVNALKRLVRLQPNREADWLREIANAYRDATEWDSALSTAQQLISRMPANADGYLIYADLAFAAGRPADAIQKLHQAIQHSEQPNDVRLRLARHYSSLGKFEEARDVYEEAFEEEQDPTGKIGLIKPLTEVYFSLGRADELVEKFQQRQLAEQAGARYALYLAAIHTQLQDFSNARKELSRALANRQKDPQLLTQLIRLAEAEGNTNELLRFQRMLTDLEPSVRNKAELAQALVTNGEMESALRLVESNRGDLLEKPGALRTLLGEANDPVFAAQLAGLFAESLQERPQDWAGRMLLGDLYLAEGEPGKAEAVFWEVLQMKEPTEELTETTSGEGSLPAAGVSLPALTMMAKIYRSPLAQRLGRTPQMRQQATPKIMGRGLHFPGMGGSSRSLASTSSVPNTGLAEAQDAALVHLALIAMNQQREAEFLQRLDKSLDERQANDEDRLLTYAIIESPTRLLESIGRYLKQPERRTESADHFAIMLLLSYSGRNQPDERKQVVEEYLEQFYERLEDAAPGISVDVALSRFQLLTRMGRHQKAEKVAFEALRQFESEDPLQIRTAYNLALSSNQLVRAEQLLQRMLDDGNAGQFRHQVVHMAFNLAKRLYQDPVLRESALKLTERLLTDIYGFQNPSAQGLNQLPAMATGYQAMGSKRSAWRNRAHPLHYQQSPPGPNDFLSQKQIDWLNQIFREMKDDKNRKALFEILAKQEKEFSDDRQVYPQLTRAYASWNYGDRKEALKQVQAARKSNPNDSLRLTEAAILFHLKRYDQALNQLRKIKDDAGDVYIDAQFWMLAVAKATKQKDLARQVARRLNKLNLPLHLRMALAQELNQMQMQKEAKAINQAAQRQRPKPRYNAVQRLERQLSRMRDRKEPEKAEQLARRILSQNPLAPNARVARGARVLALSSLKKHDRLNDYIAEIEDLAAKSPNSPRFELLLGEAKVHTDAEQALEHFQRACELRPRDVALHLKIANVLEGQKRRDEALLVYEKAIKLDPVAVLQQRSSQVIRAFKDAKRLDELVELAREFPNHGRLPGINSPLNGFFQQFGRELKKMGQLDLAIEVWKTGLYHGNLAHLNQCQMILDALLEQNRENEAAAFLQNFLFQDSRRPSPELFVLANGGQLNLMQAYFSQIHFNGSRVSSPLLDMILSIREPTATAKLRAAVHAESLAQPDNWYAQAMDAMLQLHGGETESSDRLAELLDEGLDRRSGLHDFHKVNVLRLFANKLLDMEGHRALGLAALQRAAKFSDQQRHNYPNRIGIRLELVRTAQQIGRDDIAKQSLDDVLAIFDEQAAAGRPAHHFDQLMTVAEHLIGLEKTIEADKVLSMAGDIPNFNNRINYQKRVGELRSEIDLMAGKVKRPVCHAWVKEISPDGTATICYEISSPLPRVSRGRIGGSHQLTIRGREFKKLDGKYRLRLSVGEDPNNMTRLVSLDAADARGEWKGKLPVGEGYLRAVLDDGQNVFYGDPIPLIPAVNLIDNPTFQTAEGGRDLPGWKVPSSVTLKRLESGPGKTGGSLELNTGTQQETTVLGPIQPLHEGDVLVLSGWLWSDPYNGERVQLGLRCYDQEGKQCGEFWARQDNAFAGRKWTWIWQQYVYKGEKAKGAFDLPEFAVSVQPVIRIRGGCRLMDFSLGRSGSEPAVEE